MPSSSRERVRKISDNKPNPDSKKFYFGYNSQKKCNYVPKTRTLLFILERLPTIQYSDIPVPGTRRTRCSECLAYMI